MVTVGLASHWPRVKTVVLHQWAQDLEDGDEHPPCSLGAWLILPLPLLCVTNAQMYPHVKWYFLVLLARFKPLLTSGREYSLNSCYAPERPVR